ncbi:MAG: sporulation transcriptional regulator SpoIIID [Bacilli bacterium]
MKKLEIFNRVYDEASYIITNKATVRQTAKVFGVSKSTIHKDITLILPKISYILNEKASMVLQQNKEERHIRGGIATKRKYFVLKKTI